MITAVITYLCGRNAGQEHFFCEQEPFLGNVIPDGITGFLLELSHHIIFADIKMFSKNINIQIFTQMIINVVKNMDDLCIAVICINKFQPVLQGGTV